MFIYIKNRGFNKTELLQLQVKNFIHQLTV